MMENHEHYEDSKDTLREIQKGMDGAVEWALGDYGKELVSKMNVYRSRGAESEKLRHLEEFAGDPDSMEFALDVGRDHPEAMVDQLAYMSSPDVAQLSPEDLAQVRRNLEYASRQMTGTEEGLAYMRTQWERASIQLDGHDFSDQTFQAAMDRIDQGHSFGYAELAAFGALRTAAKIGLYQEMDSGSQLRFAITFPAEEFIKGEMLDRIIHHFNEELPNGMGRLNEHAYSWDSKNNPLNNPNLTARQLDDISSALSKIKCNPSNSNANYYADRAFRMIAKHPNCGANTKTYAEEYRDWLHKDRDPKRI